MMSKSPTIFKLIQSLTPSEKRYFKVFINSSSLKKSNRNLQLFEAIAKQKTYDEKKIIKKLDYQDSLNGFAVAKNYLFQQVMKSLRNYHSSHTVFSEVTESFNNIEILYQKQLFGIAYKAVKKLQKLASENELDSVLISASYWELLLVEELFGQGIYKETIETCEADVEEWTDNIKNVNNFQCLFYEMNILNMKKGFDNDEEAILAFNHIMKSPLLADYENATTTTSKIYFHLIKSAYYNGILDFGKQYEWNKKLVTLYDANPVWKKQMEKLYLQSLFLYLFNLLQLGKIDEFLNNFPKLEKINPPIIAYDLKRKKEYLSLNLKFYYAISSGETEAIFKNYLTRAENYFKKSKHVISHKEEISLSIFITIGFLGMGKRDEALKWGNFTLQIIDKKILPLMYIMGLMTLITIHIELKNESNLTSLINTLKRFLVSNKKKTLVSTKLLVFYKKMLKVLHEKRKKRIVLLEFKKELMEISSQENVKSIYNIPKILLWIESQITHRKQTEIQKEYLEKRRAQ